MDEIFIQKKFQELLYSQILPTEYIFIINENFLINEIINYSKYYYFNFQFIFNFTKLI